MQSVPSFIYCNSVIKASILVRQWHLVAFCIPPSDDSLGGASGGKVKGQMTVNGHPKNQQTFARVCGYVEQVCWLHTYMLVSM